MKESKFVGTVGGYLGTAILASLLTSITLGIAAPWAICMILNYVYSNMVIEGKRLVFHGKGGSLFGSWIKWVLLTFVTFGIYGFWVPVKVLSWITENTSFEEVAQA